MERVGINTGCMNPPASYVNPKTTTQLCYSALLIAVCWRFIIIHIT